MSLEEQRRRGAAPRVAIIGSGFSGLCLGIQLSRAGFRDFTIFEKASRLGGTWRDNTYPGAACDLPSMAYCFSFEQKGDWSRKWSPHDEILEYMEHCAEKYGLGPHLRFDTEITEARFDADAGVWHLRTGGGEAVEAEILVSGVGQLSRPFVPDIPGLDDFAGTRFHSARWNHEIELEGRTVAVIGNAASAIQFIPQVAKRVKQLYVFQRSANWMMPRNDRAYSEREKRLYRRFPLLARLQRWWIWALYESQFPVFLRNEFLSKRYARMARKHMRETVHDPSLWPHLEPDYPIGGKRILISDDYYQSLNRDNVEVVTDRIDRVEANAIVTADGRRVGVDTIILGTGFRSTEFLAPIEITGLDGRRLQDEWRDGARAYLGLTVAGFPNFFMMYGPNTNLGHNSIIFMIECQAHYILDCVRKFVAGHLRYLDLKQEAMDAYDRELQERLARTAWAETGKSWYKNEAGRITNNWSSTTTRYWWHTRKADLADYHQIPRAHAPQLRAAAW